MKLFSTRSIIHFIIIFCFALLGFTFLKKPDKDYKKLRNDMVRYQIESRGIKDRKLLAALRKVPRHKFVPEKFKDYAYNDNPLPIGFGQTISQPYIVALMTELMEIDKNSRVLEIGTGSGYQAAVLAELVKKVYSVEIVKGLYQRTSTLFKNLKTKNIYLKHGDGYHGWKKHAPYDAIIVTCAASFIPPSLITQLKVGGVICIPVGAPFQVQNLLFVKKNNNKDIVTRVITQVRFVPLVRSEDK